ncbi:MAG: hypothetical protein AAFX86_00480 [Pseudomonadota bacterium]
MDHPIPLNPSGSVKRSRTDSYEHTINGLLSKRAELFNEADNVRGRLAEIKNDVAALDRTLKALGFTGDLEALMPRQKVYRLFGQGELLEACMRELRHAERPLKSREIAQAIVALQGDDARDRKHVTEITRRVSKCLRIEREKGTVRGRLDSARCLVWEVSS